MRKHLFIIALTVGALVLSACGETISVGENGIAQGITVQATGTADVVPDSVRISFGVSVLAESSEVALAQVATTADLVRETLKELGIADADLATQTLSVNPEYSYTEAEGQKIIGYRASQFFDVVIRDADAAGAVVDALVASGGKNLTINGTFPVVDDATKGAEIARKDAVEKARAKAEEYATLLGAELGDLVYLTEVSAPVNVTVGAKDYAMAESGATTIDLGTQEVTVTVEARWRID